MRTKTHIRPAKSPTKVLVFSFGLSSAVVADNLWAAYDGGCHLIGLGRAPHHHYGLDRLEGFGKALQQAGQISHDTHTFIVDRRVYECLRKQGTEISRGVNS
jgi:DNA-binding LacI/PurR family transcriptional regulator